MENGLEAKINKTKNDCIFIYKVEGGMDMPDITITLTDDQVKALEKMYNTDEIANVIQLRIAARANNFIRDEYEKEIRKKPIDELKGICPDVKVERKVEKEVEKEKELPAE